MHFNAPLISLLGLAASASASSISQKFTPSEMLTNIDTLTEKTSETNDIAQSISVTNFFQKTPQMINNFKEIITTVKQDISAMNNEKRSVYARQECLDLTNPEKCLEDLGEIVEDPSEILGGKRSVKIQKKREDSSDYTDAEQQGICTAYRELVLKSQELYQTLIDKHGVLGLTSYTKSIADELETLKKDIDIVSGGVVESVPACAQDAAQNKADLESTLEDALEEYQG